MLGAYNPKNGRYETSAKQVVDNLQNLDHKPDERTIRNWARYYRLTGQLPTNQPRGHPPTMLSESQKKIIIGWVLFESQNNRPTRTTNITKFIQDTFNITMSAPSVRRLMKEYPMSSKKERRQKPAYFDPKLVKKLIPWFRSWYTDVIGNIPLQSIVAVDFCHFASKPPFLRSWGPVHGYVKHFSYL